VPDLLRAYGEMLQRPDRGVSDVFVTLATGATALLVLFAVGSALGRLRWAWLRARRAHSHARK
jgi:hypothetical protein